MNSLSNFNPSLDVLRKKLGSTAADVYGRIYRFAQMEHGYCWASQQKIAEEVGISRNTVNKKIKLLIEDGYLEEIPSLPGRTKKYRPTGTAEIENECYIPVEEPFTPGEIAHNGVTKADTPVTKVYTKKELKQRIKESKRRKEEERLSSATHQESNLYNTPEIQMYIEITDIIPKRKDLQTIIQVIRENSFTTDTLKLYWEGWVEKKYNPNSFVWLTEWAVERRIGNKNINLSEYDPNQYIDGPYSEYIDY